MFYASIYRNRYGCDDNIGNYLHFDIICDPNVAYGSTKVASKLELWALSISLCEGNDIVRI